MPDFVSPFVNHSAVRYLRWICVAWKLQFIGLRNCLKLAFAIWVIGQLPLIVSQGIFLKLSRMVVALLAASWLVKLSIIAVAVGKYIH